MIFLTLAKVSFMMNLISIVWGVTALMLILIILIQKGKGGGLSAAFGGAGGGGLLGTKTGDFLTWITISLAVMFLLLTLVMVKFYRPTASEGLESAPVAPITAPVKIPATDVETKTDEAIPAASDVPTEEAADLMDALTEEAPAEAPAKTE
jgi:preprotein translocase subunit SecG